MLRGQELLAIDLQALPPTSILTLSTGGGPALIHGETPFGLLSCSTLSHRERCPLLFFSTVSFRACLLLFDARSGRKVNVCWAAYGRLSAGGPGEAPIWAGEDFPTSSALFLLLFPVYPRRQQEMGTPQDAFP